MTNKSPVPRLNLSPQLRRPLSLWNPLDYLILLYWVFYFPQALWWYVDTFGGGYIPGKRLDWNNSIQRQLLFQFIILTITAFVLICLFLQSLGLGISWESISFPVKEDISFSVEDVFRFVIKVVGEIVFFGIFWLIQWMLENTVGGMVESRPVMKGIIGQARGVVFDMVERMVAHVLIGVLLGVLLGAWFSVWFGVWFGVAAILAVGLLTLRLEGWFFSSLINFFYYRNSIFLLSRISTIPLPYLKSHLKKWLFEDWDNGIHNVNQLLEHSMQFIPVIQTMNKVMNTIPEEQIIWRISQLSENTYDWELIHFLSASLSTRIKLEVIKGFYLPLPAERRLQNNFQTETRLDTPSRAVAAGFWYLHEKQPVHAVEAFKVVRSLLYGEEMYILAETLAALDNTNKFHNNDINKLNKIANLNLPTFPTSDLLRPFTWQILNKFRRVIENVKIVYSDESSIYHPDAVNRALDELNNILEITDNLPKAERGLIIDIAQKWQKELLRLYREIELFEDVEDY